MQRLIFVVFVVYCLGMRVSYARDEGTVLLKNDSGVIFYKAEKGVCKKLTGITQSYSEGIAQKFSISLTQVRFVRADIFSDGSGCSAIIDTPKGLQSCVIGSIVRPKKGEYLAHTYMKFDDGKEMVVSGMCSNYLR